METMEQSIEKGNGAVRSQPETVIGRGNVQVLSGSVLKLLAVIAMLVDHGALLLVSQTEWGMAPVVFMGKSFSVYYILRRIGRLAFPLFCFLLVEGFVHTRSRKKYMANLVCFAVLSEVPFDLMVSGRWVYMGKQNIYFTLLLGVVLLCVLEWKTEIWKKGLCLVGIYVSARLLRTDYGFNGVALIGLLYILREQKLLRTFFSLPLLSGGLFALLSFVPINLYNGTRGFIRGKALKYMFYLFYPVHIIVLLAVKKLLG